MADAASYVPVDGLDAGAVLVDDLLHHRESQPGPAGLRRDVRLERTPQYIRGEARSVVLHGQPHRARAGAAFIDLDEFGPDDDARIRTPRQRILRVGNQVVDHLTQLGGVTVDRRE